MNIKNFFSVSFWTLCSRVLGLIRDVILSRYLGATMLADMFFVALKIPNLFRRFFAEGAMQGAFIPIFANKFSTNPNKAKYIASQILTLFFFIVFVVMIFLEIYADLLLDIIAPGFRAKGEEIFSQSVFLLRITTPYLFFISLVAFYSSILNTIGKFSLVAFVPSILNIVLIIFLLNGDIFANYAIAGAWAVLCAGIIQFIFVAYGCYKSKIFVKISIKYFFAKLTIETQLFFKKIVPVVLGAGVYQINIVIDIIAGSLLSAGSISYLFYADRIYQLPLALIGISIATILLPSISKNSTFDNLENKQKALLFGIILGLPASIGLIVLAQPIIKIIFLGGDFLEEDVILTSLCLMIYSISLLPNILIKIILPFFYSHGDTKRPLYNTILCLIVNIVLVFPLADKYGVMGIALATTIASYVNFITILFLALKHKYIAFNLAFYLEVLKIIMANIFLTLFLLLFYFVIDYLSISLFWERLIVIASIGFTILLMLLLLKLLKVRIFLAIINKIVYKK
jgi:putative peptidoglycan lipid II flippase